MDPFQDMEQQLVANEIRIQLLQEQNLSLRRTVNKMKAISSSTNADYSRKWWQRITQKFLKYILSYILFKI